MSIGTSGGIAVLTSFPPSLVRMNAAERMEDYDRLCVRSWIECGFHIVAFNSPDEIPPLAARYPEVEFVPASRTARPFFGRDTPLIADMLSALAGRTEPVLGIINCDLFFEPAPVWRDLPSIVSRNVFVTGQRYDVRTLSGGALHRYFPGFDYFFFDRAAAEALARSTQPFSMGLPWWDYWFPLSLMLRGYELQCVERPAILHLFHEQQVNARTPAWRRLAREFASAMVRESENGHLASPHWQTLLQLSCLVGRAKDAELEQGALDEPIIEMATHAIPLIAGNRIQMMKGALEAAPAFIPARAFENVADRIVAGTAMQRALWDDSHNDIARARANFELAAEKAPLDPGVMLDGGNFFFRQGDMQRAVRLLGRGVELLPHSAIMLNSLGSALGQVARNDEAAACFERAIEANPLYGISYYNLALLLWLKNRHMEVVARLERCLAQSPHFPEGPEWLQRVRETLASFDRNVAGTQVNR
jgi:tetratricopeptide (TPR) repeat protein